MEQVPPNNAMPQGLNPEQKNYFESLQHALTEAKQRGLRFEEEWSSLFDQNKTLREENHRIQKSYENLRIQKGGFGFKMLMFSGLGGFVTALVLCFVYLKLKPKDPHIVALHNFRREHLFEYELALSKKQFAEVKSSLEKVIKTPENQSIKTEIEILRELIEAAEKGCQ
ncbi:MAG: hypothetical protein Q7T20_05150 [Saprospiraceae bacterium]|nr:hypothetical protein [Saprospiraceae bacterium]